MQVSLFFRFGPTYIAFGDRKVESANDKNIFHGFPTCQNLQPKKWKYLSPQKNLPDMDPPSYLDAAGPLACSKMFNMCTNMKSRSSLLLIWWNQILIFFKIMLLKCLSFAEDKANKLVIMVNICQNRYFCMWQIPDSQRVNYLTIIVLGFFIDLVYIIFLI